MLKEINANLKNKETIVVPNKNIKGMCLFINSTNVEIVAEVLENTVDKTKKTKKYKLSWLFLVLNLAVVIGLFVFQFAKGDIKPLGELFAEHPYYRFLFLGFGFFLMYNVIEFLKYLLLIQTATKKWRPWVALKVCVYGRYWDFITPLGTGGQPFQIYELRKNNISGDKATGIPLARYLFWQITFIVVASIVFILPLNAISSTEANVVKYAAIIGFSFNVLLFLVNILVGLNRNIGEKLIVGTVKLGVKFKMVKKPESTINKAIVFTDNYQKCMREFVGSFKVFIVQTTLALLSIFVQFGVAYCVYLTFNYPDFIMHTWFEVIALAILCDQAISFIPLPGGAAAAEVSFVAMFATLFAVRGGGVVFWAMLFWRFFTYYLFIIQGLLLMFIDSFINKRKAKQKAVNKTKCTKIKN